MYKINYLDKFIQDKYKSVKITKDSLKQDTDKKVLDKLVRHKSLMNDFQYNIDNTNNPAEKKDNTKVVSLYNE
jgi:hypothetical protein